MPLAPDFTGLEVRHLPIISLSPESLQFAAVQGGPDPAPKVVWVKNAAGGSLTGLAASVVYDAGEPSGWLSATLRSTVVPTYVDVQATTGASQPDTLHATIVVSTSLKGVWRRGVKVTFVISRPE